MTCAPTRQVKQLRPTFTNDRQATRMVVRASRITVWAVALINEIMKGDAFGGPVRIGLIFGYPDDLAACEETVMTLNQRYPSSGFFCEAAN
jgi:hypothetical protein